MQTVQVTPKIYVACLASYNNGILHGQWIDVNKDVEAVRDEIQDMLGISHMGGAEEWAIHDYDGFEGLRLSEYEDINTVVEIAGLINKYGEAWAAYAQYMGVEYATKENFEEAYQGEWDSEEAFAEDFASETLEIPEHLQYYIDYEKLSRDLFINEYFSAKGDNYKVYVFRHL